MFSTRSTDAPSHFMDNYSWGTCAKSGACKTLGKEKSTPAIFQLTKNRTHSRMRSGQHSPNNFNAMFLLNNPG
ncbi:MAG: hypothetical protein Q8L65_17490 [Burkholderiales bacterium]|nr:hypothetical protein [Burkholderiales bacterium]